MERPRHTARHTPGLRAPAGHLQRSSQGPTGTIVDTGSDTKTDIVVGPRYPLEIYGDESSVRAEAVVSVICL